MKRDDVVLDRPTAFFKPEERERLIRTLRTESLNREAAEEDKREQIEEQEVNEAHEEANASHKDYHQSSDDRLTNTIRTTKSHGRD